MEFLDNMLLQAIDYEWDTTGHLPTYSTLVSPWTLSICGGHLWLSIFHVSIFFHFFCFSLVSFWFILLLARSPTTEDAFTWANYRRFQVNWWWRTFTASLVAAGGSCSWNQWWNGAPPPVGVCWHHLLTRVRMQERKVADVRRSQKSTVWRSADWPREYSSLEGADACDLEASGWYRCRWI